jgi:hypothetical protein
VHVAERRREVRVARHIFVSFIITFVVARIVVYLAMSGRFPDIYMQVGETHVHHLNYGIFLLSGVGAYALFRRPAGKALAWAAIAFGIGLALTFDEFGMWLNLGGGYWQRASFDAMSVIAAVLGLIAYAPAMRRFRPRHWATATIVAVMTAAFFVLLIDSFHHITSRVGPHLRRLDEVREQVE